MDRAHALCEIFIHTDKGKHDAQDALLCSKSRDVAIPIVVSTIYSYRGYCINIGIDSYRANDTKYLKIKNTRDLFSSFVTSSNPTEKYNLSN